MPHCRSWRPVRVSGHESAGHAPFECRRCWKPCRQQVERGTRRCDDCEQALATHPDLAVRKALLDETEQSEKVLNLLTADGNIMVAERAQLQLTRRQEATDEAVRT